MRLRPAAAASLLLIGCASETPAPDPDDPILQTLSQNLFTTHYSARVNVEESRLRDDTAALTGEDGLAAIEYSATVLETYRGKPLERISYLHFVDPDDRMEGHTRGEIIVSLCREHGGDYLYLPEVGYEMPATHALVARARELSGRLSSRGAGATEGHACR